MGKILWIIGAGTSKHLGMPLLTEFRSFFHEIWWRFPENQNDAQIQNSVPCSIEIMNSHPEQNIEQLLLPSSPLTDSNRMVLKNAIRRSFECRQLGRIAKLIPSHTPGIRHKFDVYARLLCCMEDGDAIVSFNYDNAFEFVLACISGTFRFLNISELKDDQSAFLQKQGRDLWISGDLHEALRKKSIRYSPAASFVGDVPIFGNGVAGIDLIKIHGSINWFKSESNRVHAGSPESTSRVPLLAYPEPNKPDTRVPPFSDIMNEAISSLHRFDRVVIIGYSFPQSDSTGHPFIQELKQNMKQMKVLAVDPFPGTGLMAALEDVPGGLIVDEFFENSFQSNKFNGKTMAEYVNLMRQPEC